VPTRLSANSFHTSKFHGYDLKQEAGLVKPSKHSGDSSNSKTPNSRTILLDILQYDLMSKLGDEVGIIWKIVSNFMALVEQLDPNHLCCVS
jgi:hypothetical protein